MSIEVGRGEALTNSSRGGLRMPQAGPRAGSGGDGQGRSRDQEGSDLVACLGVYYHTMQHYRMMMQMTAFRPRLIIIDSMFSRSAEAVIEVGWEDTAHELNSTAQMAGQNKVPTGRPSLAAVSMMAESVGYTMTEQPWDVPKEQRASVADYHDKFANRRRHTVSFTPTSPLT